MIYIHVLEGFLDFFRQVQTFKNCPLQTSNMYGLFVDS